MLTRVLTADNTPLRDPSHLFTAPLYLTHGRAVFWPDLSKDHPHNAIWRIVGQPCSLESWTFESGQIVIDKAGNHGLNLAALLIAAGMQDERDFWFHMCGGDKDTFRWGFEILGLPYGESPRWMGAVGIENRHEGDRFCGQ
jgi:alpha 1,2-mannosyltransferase